MPSSNDRPLIALAVGDPAGIGPELAVRLLSDDDIRQTADILVISDRRVLDLGGEQAKLTFDLPDLAGFSDNGRALADLAHFDPLHREVSQVSRAGGDFSLVNFRVALRLGAAGIADAVAFTPFNKQSMRMAESDYVDEIGFIRRTIGAAKDGSEFNILEEVWNARVTSHVPLGEVAALITRDRVERSIDLTVESMQAAGFERPRIAVAGLNPHAGDGGNFGSEEIEVIEPAVKAAAARQIAVEGPFSPDTVFLRAKAGLHDAVLTMYHDQGQIAMKLIGFDRGITLIGGYPFPITTPAHGTAFDIAGQGIANPNAAKRALEIGADMAKRFRAKRFRGDTPFPDRQSRQDAIHSFFRGGRA
ncbi:MAG: 4-hydroxythreonine-4-phosphate dehydrogenase PdxA [Geminicoccaceae bacterium]